MDFRFAYKVYNEYEKLKKVIEEKGITEETLRKKKILDEILLKYIKKKNINGG